ncbi:hypothetical protein BGZ46_006374 [Entomortierella lignicola]|nr:hypothetical protein BGZ46_006374 [Entomortierella lignicola]
MTTSQFSPASVIDRFMALRSLTTSESSSPSAFSTLAKSNSPNNITKGQERIRPNNQVYSVSITTTSKSRKSLNFEKSHQSPVIDQLTKKQSTFQTKVESGTTPPKNNDNYSNADPKPRISTIRPYDPLPLPASSNVHRYIVSNRVLQNTAIIRALIDPDCGRVELIDRDVEYMRALLPENTANRLTTHLEADIILDENNAVILYSLREIGQATAQDPNAGLNELVAILGRVGPRYKVIWLIMEEYSWARLPPSISTSNRSALRGVPLMPAPGGMGPRFTNNTRVNGNYSAPSQTEPVTANQGFTRLDPYAGPVMVQLNKLMVWTQTTDDRQSWWARSSNQNAYKNPRSLYDPFYFVSTRIDELKFETKVLFSSDERCTACLSRAIGDGIANSIGKMASAGVRREEDGWQDQEEWVWREWLNEQDT